LSMIQTLTRPSKRIINITPNPFNLTMSSLSTTPSKTPTKAVADLCDDYIPSPTPIHIVNPCIFKDYGGKKSFSGKIRTVKCHESNPLVKDLLSSKPSSPSEVLVVDGGGSLRCALLGDMIASLAVQNGWSGIIINGCIRDSKVISTMDIGVKARGTMPVKSLKNNPGVSDVAVAFEGVEFVPGHYLYADEDGIIVSEKEVR
jgi:regulator of ribonuclease activity A